MINHVFNDRKAGTAAFIAFKLMTFFKANNDDNLKKYRFFFYFNLFLDSVCACKDNPLPDIPLVGSQCEKQRFLRAALFFVLRPN